MAEYPRRFTVTRHVRLTGTFDEAARIAAVPPSMTTKGMYFANFMSRLDRAEIDAVLPRLRKPPTGGVYQPFLPYPFADVIVWLHVVAKKAHPRLPLLEAIRYLGRDTVIIFLESKAGRVVKEMMGGPRQSLLRMPDMWKITDPESHTHAEAIEERAVRFIVNGFPAWIDCGLIGTLEQVVHNHHVEPTIEVELRGPMQARLVVRWEGDPLPPSSR